MDSSGAAARCGCGLGIRLMTGSDRMYNFDKMSKKPLGVRIEDELMKYILQEPVEPGEKIPNEFELAERFGVGRSTIREAVKGLVSRGILEVSRGSGTYVINTNSFDEDPLGLSKMRLLRQSLPQILLLWKIHILAVQREVKGPDGMRRPGFSGFGHP